MGHPSGEVNLNSMLEITWNHHITNEQLELYETNVSLLFAFGISSIMLCFIHASSYSVWWFQPTWKILDNQKSKWIISQIGVNMKHIGNHRPYFPWVSWQNPLSHFFNWAPHNSSDEKLIIPRAISLPWWQMRRASLRKNLLRSHRMNHKFPDWKFWGPKKSETTFPTRYFRRFVFQKQICQRNSM